MPVRADTKIQQPHAWSNEQAITRRWITLRIGPKTIRLAQDLLQSGKILHHGGQQWNAKGRGGSFECWPDPVIVIEVRGRLAGCKRVANPIEARLLADRLRMHPP